MTKTFKFLCTITLFFIFGYSCQKAKTQSDRSLLASYTEEEHVDEWFLRTEDKASNLYIKEIGSGEPVLVLHGGFGNDHTNVVKVSNGLTDTFRFVFYDQRGSSLSYCEREAITVDNHVQDIETIRKALGIEKLTLVTHSASTILGFLYLEKFPDNVKRIVFLGAMHPKNGNGNKEIFTDEEWNTFEVSDKEKQQFNSRPEIDKELLKAGFTSNKGLNPKQRQKYNQIKYFAGQNIYHVEKWKELNLPHWNKIAAQASSGSFNWEYDFTDLLSKQTIPISVINGEYDFVVGGKGSPIWNSVIRNKAKNIEFNMINNAGHVAWIDDPINFKTIFKNALLKN